MNSAAIPSVPQWKYQAGFVVTPDGGLLYTGTNTINYIPITGKGPDCSNNVLLYTKSSVKRIDCDLVWNEHKYFACLASDDTISIWDLTNGKVVMGHKSHSKPAGNDQSASETVCISFACNSKLVSIDSKSLVLFCLLSNTFVKKNRIVAYKHFVTALKCSPYKESIFAAGTSRGLVMIIDYQAEQILHSVAGRTNEVTSLSWSINMSSADDSISDAVSDDIFDVYKVSDREEFGVISRKEALTSDDDTGTMEREQPTTRNENFDFVEACSHLRDQILERKANPTNYAIEEEPTEPFTNLSTFETCTSSVGETGSVSNSNHTSNNSIGKDIRAKNFPEMYLASGFRDFTISVWKVSDTVTEIPIPVNKSRHKKHANKVSCRGHYCSVSWLDNTVLATNYHNGGCALYRLQTIDDVMSFKKWKTFEEFTFITSIPRSNTIWLIHPQKNIICYDVVMSSNILEFNCISSDIATMNEIPGNLHTIAIACRDRRVALVNTSNILNQSIKLTSLSKQIYSAVISLSFCPKNSNFLAFGTDEGRIGIINLALLKNNLLLLKPFSGKPVYSVDWIEESFLLVCIDGKIGMYSINEPNKEVRIIKKMSSSSTISVRGNHILIGNQSGDMTLYVWKKDILDFEPVEHISIGSKYISDISWSSIDKNKFAVCSFSNKCSIVQLVPETNLRIIREYTMNESPSGAVCVRWSNHNEHLLVCSGLDGIIRLFDTSLPTEQPIAIHNLPYSISCAMFSPTDDNLIIFSGRGTTIGFLNITNILGSNFTKQNSINSKLKPPEMGWAKCVEKQSKCQTQTTVNTGDDSDNSISDKLQSINLDSKDHGFEELKVPSSMLPQKQATLFHILSKEINKHPLEIATSILNHDESLEQNHKTSNRFVFQQLFGKIESVEELLKFELQNHLKSSTGSIATYVIPQMQKTLKEDIIERVRLKKLTEFDVSLAPTISYEFWRNCCLAYANQLVEAGLPLNALPFFLAVNEIKNCIKILLKFGYFSESYVIAKLYLPGDNFYSDLIVQEWIEFLKINGNFEGAVLLCVLAQKYDLAISFLKRRRDPPVEILNLLKMLEIKIESSRD